MLEVGRGGLPPLFRMARTEVAGASHPSLPLIFIGISSTLSWGIRALENCPGCGSFGFGLLQLPQTGQSTVRPNLPYLSPVETA